MQGVDTHRMNEAQGLYEFYIRFYSGYHDWKLYPEVQGLDAVMHYVKLHSLYRDTRQQTPLLQYARLTGRAAVPSRSAPASVAADAGEEGKEEEKEGQCGEGIPTLCVPETGSQSM